MKKTRVTIILLNWNGYKDTLVCLKSLYALKLTNTDLNIVVVDNASTDHSVQILREKYPRLPIVELPANRGFTGGNNEGIRYATAQKADYIWFLNNDTIVDSNALEALLDAFQDPSVGIAGSKIYFMKHFEFHASRYRSHELGKVLWYAGGIIDWSNIYGSHRGVDEVDHGQYDQEEETPFVTGCSLMISKECLELVEGFDNKYFAFLEDLDMCLKVAYTGYKVMYIPQSIVWHKNAGSTGGPGNVIHQYYMTRNRFLFGMRYASLRTKFALLRESFRLMRYGTSAQRHAIIDALVGRWGKRRE